MRVIFGYRSRMSFRCSRRPRRSHRPSNRVRNPRRASAIFRRVRDTSTVGWRRRVRAGCAMRCPGLPRPSPAATPSPMSRPLDSPISSTATPASSRPITTDAAPSRIGQVEAMTQVHADGGHAQPDERGGVLGQHRVGRGVLARLERAPERDAAVGLEKLPQRDRRSSSLRRPLRRRARRNSRSGRARAAGGACAAPLHRRICRRRARI